MLSIDQLFGESRFIKIVSFYYNSYSCFIYAHGITFERRGDKVACVFHNSFSSQVRHGRVHPNHYKGTYWDDFAKNRHLGFIEWEDQESIAESSGMSRFRMPRFELNQNLRDSRIRYFFLNYIRKCPFCDDTKIIGEYESPDQVLEVFDVTKTHSSPVKFGRCKRHAERRLGFKQYLKHAAIDLFAETYGKRGSSVSKAVQQQAILKRIRRVKKVRPLDESEREFFGMILGLKKLNQVTK